MLENKGVIAIVPARGSSKRIPRKNLHPILGQPLLAYTLEAARSARSVQRVLVSTDDPEVAQVSRERDAEVILRPAEISGDRASSESALLHVLDHLREREGYEPDLAVFLQCTSPVREAGDIDKAVETLRVSGADSLFSACRNDKFIWRMGPKGPVSLNYDFRNRVREQDFPVEYRENGSIYVFKPDILRRMNNRLGGKIAVYEMDYWSSFQLDTWEDLEMIEWILSKKRKPARLESFRAG